MNKGFFQNVCRDPSLLVARLTWLGKSRLPQRMIAIPGAKLLYLPMPKAASSSMVLMLSRLAAKEGLMTATEAALSGRELRHALSRRTSLGRKRYSEARGLLDDPDFFRFTIVRNPWSRILSAFLDKFVTTEPMPRIAARVVENIAAREGREPDMEAGITFRTFVTWLSAQEDTGLDQHWRSQSDLLGDLEFDRCFHLETLATDLPQALAAHGLEIAAPKVHASRYGSDQSLGGHAADAVRSELRKLSANPPAVAFYDQELTALVGERYQEDTMRFEYGPADAGLELRAPSEIGER